MPDGEYVPIARLREAEKRIAELEEALHDERRDHLCDHNARAEAERIANDARNDNEAIHRELDRLGAPRRQDNGYGFSPLGRLRRLSVNEAGKGLVESIYRERDEALAARDGAFDVQRALMAQTVRIRRVLASEVRDGVDTEEIAKEVVRERDEAREDVQAARRERDEAIRERDSMDTEAQHRAARYCREKRAAEHERDEWERLARKERSDALAIERKLKGGV